jgi:hypothetical protein
MEKAEAQKVQVVKAAEAEAEAKYLQGQVRRAGQGLGGAGMGGAGGRLLRRLCRRRARRAQRLLACVLGGHVG